MKQFLYRLFIVMMALWLAVFAPAMCQYHGLLITFGADTHHDHHDHEASAIEAIVIEDIICGDLKHNLTETSVSHALTPDTTSVPNTTTSHITIPQHIMQHLVMFATAPQYLPLDTNSSPFPSTKGIKQHSTGLNATMIMSILVMVIPNILALNWQPNPCTNRIAAYPFPQQPFFAPPQRPPTPL